MKYRSKMSPEPIYPIEWGWDKDWKTDTTQISPCGFKAKFNEEQSLGTAVVIGSKGLESNQHHFWEMKWTKRVYGTDVMVGLTTDRDIVNKGNREWFSLLGSDSNSWGFSYTGKIQHNNRSLYYVRPDRRLGLDSRPIAWREGDRIGVHLDTFRGRLMFYVNCRTYGEAYCNLPKDKLLYPAISCTARMSGVELTCAFSLPASLSVQSAWTVWRQQSINSVPRSLLLSSFHPVVSRVLVSKFWFPPDVSPVGRDDRQAGEIQLDDTDDEADRANTRTTSTKGRCHGKPNETSPKQLRKRVLRPRSRSQVGATTTRQLRLENADSSSDSESNFSVRPNLQDVGQEENAVTNPVCHLPRDVSNPKCRLQKSSNHVSKDVQLKGRLRSQRTANGKVNQTGKSDSLAICGTNASESEVVPPQTTASLSSSVMYTALKNGCPPKKRFKLFKKQDP